MWWILLLFVMVFADDDEWFIDDEEVPPATQKLLAQQSFLYPQNAKDIAHGNEKKASGFYQYKYIEPTVIPEALYRQCYDAGHGQPIKYPGAADVWDSINKHVRSIEADEVWCSMPTEKFEVSSDDLAWNTTLWNMEKAIKKTMEEQFASPSTTHGVSNGVTFPVGDTRHYNDPVVKYFPTPTSMVNRIRVHFPYNRENARDRAIRIVKQSLQVASFDSYDSYCNLWNIVSSGGYEIKEMPEYDQYISDYIEVGHSFYKIVSLVEGKYPVEVNVNGNWTSIDHTNVDEFVEELSTDPGHSLRNLLEVRFIHRLGCEDYGYENFVQEECDNQKFKDLVSLNPNMISNGDDLCRNERDENDVKVKVYDVGHGKHYATEIQGLVRFGGQLPSVIEKPDSIDKIKKLICKLNHNMIPIQTDHDSTKEYKFRLETIHNAHMAVMTWAHVNCKNRDGDSFHSKSEFSCLLGVNDISMRGRSFTIPLPFGFQVGWTMKDVSKEGLSFIVKGHYSFCMISQEEAKMQGPKVSWSPIKFKQSIDDAKKLLANKQNGLRSMNQAIAQRMKQQAFWKNPQNLIYNKNRRGWGIGTKFLIGNLGREATNKGVREYTKFTGIPLRFETEYWMEEGSCTPGSTSGSCKMKTNVYSWDMIAATASFFSASARVSYIRVYKTGYESDDPDQSFVNSLYGNFINSGVLSFYSGPSEGWDRYLLQLKARIQIIPNLGQVANVVYGRPMASVAGKGSQAAWAKASKNAGSGAKAKFGIKNILGELVLSLEKAHGQGKLKVNSAYGGLIENTATWEDFHQPYTSYWHDMHKIEYTRPRPHSYMLPCEDSIDDNDPSTYLKNRFPINSCRALIKKYMGTDHREVLKKPNDRHPDYMPVFAPTREVQLRIPITHKANKGQSTTRRILVKIENTQYKKPDISFDINTKLGGFTGFVTKDDTFYLSPNKINHIMNLHLDNLGNLSDSYIHGLSDTLEENKITMNPWSITNANENNGEVKVHIPRIQILEYENCDVMGLTSIRHITDPFNFFLGDYIFEEGHPYNVTESWDQTVMQDSFIEVTDNGTTITEDEVENIHQSPLRPYGLIVSGYRGGKPLDIRQTERYLYGQEAMTSGMLTKHGNCRPDYRCICLGPSDYEYVQYGMITSDTTYMWRIDLIMHPVDTYQECKIAHQHRLSSFDETMFKDLSYYMNKRYEGEGVQIVYRPDLGAGCIYDIGSKKIVFNAHRDARFKGFSAESYDSVVKVLKLETDISKQYAVVNGDGESEYQRFITRRNGLNINDESIPNLVQTKLNDAVAAGAATRVSLEPKENHNIGQVQLIHQDGVLKYFPVGKEYEALKDTKATHILYGDKIHTWRFVDQYLKTNKQKVEKYYEENDRRTMTYLDMNDHVWNELNTKYLPKGTAEYSFVKNLGSYVAADNEVIVPEVDFIADRKISFHGKNIPMEVKDPMNYTTDTFTPANGISCEVSLMLPNRCPAGYGMDGDLIKSCSNYTFTTENSCTSAGHKWDKNLKDVYGVPYKYGDKRQCALCPIVNTCRDLCTSGYTKDCLDCLSPEGHYRCQIDVTKCDTPGYVWVTTHRGGKRGHLTGHCVKTDRDPKEEDEWHTTNLQKEYWDRGEPFFPHRWEKDGIPYIRNEKSNTSYLTCNPGYVPVKATNETKTCSGYVCEKCPPTYIEENQICVKCGEREVAGHLLDQTGENANKCQKVTVPVGHFFDSQNQDGVTINEVDYPFVSHCDHWLNHPAGAIGAFQNEENQLVCKTSNTTHTNFGEHAVLFKGGIVKFWSTPGHRVNDNRTAVVACKDHQVCNGEEITGCKPGYIWKQQTYDTREDEECFICNNDTTILNMHGERDNYEYCDGTHMFRCADASYTDAYELGFKPKIAGIHKDLFVGVRDEWEASWIVKELDIGKFVNWNQIPLKSQSSGDTFTEFKNIVWRHPVKGDHKANWRSFKGRDGARGIEWYSYDETFTPVRVEDNKKFNPGAKCYPVPDGFFALPNEWKLKDCGFSKELCVHRTFHEIIPFKPNCTIADKHFLSNAVKEDCYDYVYRWEDRMCTDGLLPGGCNKEYCTREGQSNCWCGDEEDFCTMGCVNGMCQEICGDRVCKEYELCYGEFNAIKSFAQCVIECQEPKSNYCLWENDEGNTVYCRHFNTDWNSTIMQTLDPKPTSPCFDEMPNIPETQCQDPFDSECFCGRTFIDNPNQACVDKQVKGFCTVFQDDGTCTYETSNDGTCVCGDVLVDTKRDEKCYAIDEACGPQARTKQLCNVSLGDEDLMYIPGCQPTGVETNISYCAKADYITKEYVDIAQEPNLKCIGEEVAEIEGCVDPQGKNYNEFATIPKKCQY